MAKTIEFITLHYVDMFQAVLLILAALGMILEAINRIFPTKNPDSFLSKAGAFLVKAGVAVKKLMDFFKIPNNLKK